MKRVVAAVGVLMLVSWSGASGATAALGGYRASSTASGVEVLYNDGSEVDLTIPSATSSVSTGAGHALAAPLYPGSVGGNPGATLKQFLGSHLPPSLADALGQLNYPLQAEAYASGPTDQTFPTGGLAQALTDVAHVDSDGTHALATGTLVGVGLESSAKSTSDVTDAKVTSTAIATVSDIDIGGVVHIGQASSTATASSDGTTGRSSASTSIAGLSVAGMSVELDPDQLKVGPAAVPLNLGGLLNPVLKALGIVLTVTPEHHTISGAKAVEQASALTISIAPPGNGGNTFLVTVGGATAQAQASEGFGGSSTTPVSGPSTAVTPPSTDLGSVPVGTVPSGLADAATGSTTSTAPSVPVQTLAVVPAASERSKPVPVGLLVFGLLVGGAAAFGLARVRDDVLAERAGGSACPLEGSER